LGGFPMKKAKEKERAQNVTTQRIMVGIGPRL